MPLVAGLTATLASLRLARRLRLIRGRVGGRRPRGVRGVLPEALTQFGDLSLEVIDLCDLLTKCGELLLVSSEADGHQAHLLLKSQQESAHCMRGTIPVALCEPEVTPHGSRG